MQVVTVPGSPVPVTKTSHCKPATVAVTAAPTVSGPGALERVAALACLGGAIPAHSPPA